VTQEHTTKPKPFKVPPELRHTKETKDAPRPLLHEPIWERQDRESGRAFEAFTTYRDLGLTRTIRAAAEAQGITLRLGNRFATRWRWAERALAHDRMRDQAKDEAARKKAAELGEKHARIASQHLASLLAPVAELGKRLSPQGNAEGKKLDLSKLTDADLLRMVQRNGTVVRSLAELERLSNGLPNTITAATDTNGKDVQPAQQQTVVDALREMFAKGKKP